MASHEIRVKPHALPQTDALVAGAGPAGLAAALALAVTGIDAAVVAPSASGPSAPGDTRTTALFGGSIELLRHVGAWKHLEPDAEPLVGLRLIDDTGSLLRAPETLFRAGELGLACFGYNVENVTLNAALARAADANSRIRFIDGTVIGVETGGEAARVLIRTGVDDADASIDARLIVAADGRRSACRQAAGIGVEAWSYPQSAIAVRFMHSRPHDGISTEFHRRSGPLTTVPLKGRSSSLVWVEIPTEAERLRDLAEPDFIATLEFRLQGLLGKVTAIGPRAVFPLSGLTAEPLAKGRVVLVGEAAHVLPPIGAQGLNLGFRDAAWIAALAGDGRRQGRDIGGWEVIESYARARRPDVASRSLAVDAMNRSLLADFLPFDLARGVGLAALNAVPWLRKAVMREGIEPGVALPPLLRAPTVAV